MPEGPEVRVVGEFLNHYLGSGSILEEVLMLNDSTRGAPAIPLVKLSLSKVFTHGKLIVFDFGERRLISSLGMTGIWSILPGKSHGRFALKFRNCLGRIMMLYYSDVRNFGKLQVLDQKGFENLLENRGVDPFETEITVESFAPLRSSRRQLGPALLDQSCIVGIGNYLKSDILWQARLSPMRKFNSLSEEELSRLSAAINDLMRRSYELGGYSFRDYVHPDGKAGEYVPLIYGRETTTEGNPVVKFSHQSRVTYMVPELQQ